MSSDQALGTLDRFVLGGAQLGLAYGATNQRAFDRNAAASVVEAALDRGVTHIDTARAYGQSEEVIGEVLHRRGVDPVETVVTKVDPLVECDLLDRPTVRLRLSESLEASRTLLRADRLGTVLLHREEHLDPSLPWILDCLLDARERGVLTNIGVSVSTPEGLQRAIAIGAISHVQFPFSILDDRWPMDVIPERITVHCRSIFLQGVLLGAGNALPMASRSVSGAVFRMIENYVADLGYGSRLELLCDYVRWHHRVDGAVIGAVVAEELDEVLDSWLLDTRLTDARVSELRSALSGLPTATLDPSRWIIEDAGGE